MSNFAEAFARERSRTMAGVTVSKCMTQNPSTPASRCDRKAGNEVPQRVNGNGLHNKRRAPAPHKSCHCAARMPMHSQRLRVMLCSGRVELALRVSRRQRTRRSRRCPLRTPPRPRSTTRCIGCSGFSRLVCPRGPCTRRSEGLPARTQHMKQNAICARRARTVACCLFHADER